MVSRTDSAPSAAGLLRRYLQVYWLKPFDAVNDAANAWALRQFQWEGPILEVGGGDGVFSFIMHGGEFILTDDRYAQSDLARQGDIFDTYRRNARLTVKRPAACSYLAGVDLKWSHVLKARDTRLYHSLVVSAPEPLPFAAGSFKTVCLYFPHGLKERGEAMDYARTLKEIRRVIRPDGTLLMTAVNRNVRRSFVCHPLHRLFSRAGWTSFSEYFKRLDAGRYEEIAGLGHSLEEWTKLLDGAGFRLADAWTQVSPLAWRVYDVQTRPLLRPLIRWNSYLTRMGLKGPVKAIWVCVWWPVLALFYTLYARPRRAWPASWRGAGVMFAFRVLPA